MKSLYLRVLVAIAIGIALGAVWPDGGIAVEPLGQGFIKLIKMTIAPLIFCTVVVGIANMKSMKAVGRAGGLALLYFEVASTVALLIGLTVINVVRPGAGMDVDPAKLDTSQIDPFTKPGQLHGVADFILGIIPDSFFGALVHGDLLPVLLVSILFGFALQKTGEQGRPVFMFIDRAGKVIFEVISLIMKLAPIGAFGAIAATIGRYGIGTLASLAELMACFYATCLLFVFGVLGLVARVHGFSIVRFVRLIADELLIVLGTSSSESVLPRLMEKLEGVGASKPVVGLVVPAGYSFNLDGTAIYLTMAAVFVAQATNTRLGMQDQLVLLAVLLLSSKGAAGVTGSGFIVLAATLDALGKSGGTVVPAAGLAIIFGIDRFMSEARALTNVVGNGVATIVVAKWCGELDEEKLKKELG